MKHRTPRLRPTRLAAVLAGAAVVGATLTGTAFAADGAPGPSMTAHEAHVNHVNHRAHIAHLVHLANEAAKASAASHAAHAAHEAHTIAAANAAARAKAASDAHAAHQAHVIAAANAAARAKAGSHADHAAHEAHRIAAANAASRAANRPTLGTPAASGYASPVPRGTSLSQPFGVPNSGYAAGYHTGCDFAVSVGTPLYAVGNSTVVSAGWAGAYGNSVTLRLADGHYALYAHMSSVSVSAGQTLSAGQQIGRSGNTGNSTGPHMHFEIRTTNSYGAVINPVSYLQGKGVSL
ncbi:M23 family metallopeptidase [Streptomyces sp. NPDC092296]|uniref:M23 family metallopeptidase n=1 Tax=Streptomyces sp. NPDC092296 TaxID=3366012 RepID=UPI00380C8E9A